MTSGDLTIACSRRVAVGTDMAVRAERQTQPDADHWMLCVDTTRASIRLAEVVPAALDYAIDDGGALHLMFPADVLSVELTIDAGEVGEAEWRFWAEDIAVVGCREHADA